MRPESIGASVVEEVAQQLQQCRACLPTAVRSGPPRSASRRRTSSSTGPPGRRWPGRRARPSRPTRSSGCAASGTPSTSTRCARSTSRSPGCSACGCAPRSRLHRKQEEFLQQPQPPRTPFVIGLAGSVAVGKSTTARVLQQMLAHWPAHPHVALVTTDGFLYPNAELERRGILHRKGFPESYDRRALLRFLDRHQVGPGRGDGADLLAPRLRRGAGRARRGQAPRHHHHRGPQRPPAGAGARGRAQRAWR